MIRECPKTLIDSVEEKVKACPENVCFFGESENGWEPYTHQQFFDHVQALARSLQARGVEKGDCIGILARPSYEWEVADKAIMYLGATSVGLDYKSSMKDLGHIINATSLKGLFVEDDERSKLVAEEDLRGLDFLYRVDELPNRRQDSNHYLLWDEVRQHRSGDRLASKARPDDIGVIVFTSGTTGKPKGIPLSHSQMTASLPLMHDVFVTEMVGADLRTMAWIPLQSATGRMMGSINYFLDGVQYFVKDPRTLFDKIKEVNPTYLIVVPHILEKVYKKVQEKLQERSRTTQLALKALLHLRERLPTDWAKNLTDRLLIGKLRRAIWGEELQVLISGSAPIDANILKFFDSLGVPTYEVYAMSEIGGPVSMNRPQQIRYGSVGQPLDYVDVRIAADNEVMVKTSAALESYWGENGSQLYDSDGYLKTGDLGEFRDGFLYLTGRKKEIIKTSTGQRISPVAVETNYKDIPGVDQIVVIGSGRKYLTALISMDEEFERCLQDQHGSLEDYLSEEIEKRKVTLAPIQQIKRFAVLPRPLSVAGGEITPTLKVRRTVVEQKYKEMIDSIYLQNQT